MDTLDREATLPQLGKLIFHQGDERADHQRRPAPCEPRQLIAERFPCPGWHHEKNVAAINDGAANLFLIRAKRRKTERPMQESIQSLPLDRGHRSFDAR